MLPALPYPWIETRAPSQRPVVGLCPLQEREDRAARRRLVAAERATDGDRLAGHHSGDRVPVVHGVGVHDPGHGLGVGIHVGRGDVAVGTDERADLRREPAGEPLDLPNAQLLGVDNDAALGTAVRDVDAGALPAHPHGQCANLVQRHVLVIADAALPGPAADVVLHAVAGEDLHAAVVHGDGEVDGELTLRDAEHPTHAVVEIELVRRMVELGLGDGPDVRAPRQRGSGWPSGELSASCMRSAARRLYAPHIKGGSRPVAVTVADSIAPS